MALAYLKYGLTEYEAHTGILIAQSLKEHNALSLKAYRAEEKGESDKADTLNIYATACRKGIKSLFERITYSVDIIKDTGHGLSVDEIEAAIEMARLLKRHKLASNMERETDVMEEKKGYRNAAANDAADAQKILREKFNEYVYLRGE